MLSVILSFYTKLEFRGDMHIWATSKYVDHFDYKDPYGDVMLFFCASDTFLIVIVLTDVA